MRRLPLFLMLLLAGVGAHAASTSPLAALDREIGLAAERAAPLVVRLQAPQPLQQPYYDGFMGGRTGNIPSWPPYGYIDPSWTRWTTGFLWDREGHVVASAMPNGQGATRARWASGREVAVTAGWPEPDTPLRVLRTEPAAVTPLPIGDSRALRPGALLIVVAAGPNGTPGAYPCTLAAVETEPEPRLYLSTIPGNSASGAPVLNRRGELVAVVLGPAGSAYEAGSAGLAMPIHAARPVIEKALAAPPAGYLGIGATSLQSAEGGTGLIVGEVLPGSPVALAGVQPGDVIAAVGGKAIRDRDEFAAAVRALVAGKATELTLLRKGERIQVPITPAPLPVSQGAC